MIPIYIFDIILSYILSAPEQQGLMTHNAC